MFGFNKEVRESEKISRCWEKVKTSFEDYLPSKLFESETHGTEGKLFGLTNIYPVLRFMCVDLQTASFKERILEVEKLLDFYLEMNEKVVIESLKRWGTENAPLVVSAILKSEGLEGRGTTAELLRQQQLTISLSKDPNLLIKRADIQSKFMPNYVRAAIDANIDEVLNLELSRTSYTSNNA